MKPKLAFLSALMLVVLACNATKMTATPPPSQPPSESPGDLTAAPTNTVPAIESPTPAPPDNTGIPVSYLGTSFTIPSGLATGTRNEVIPETNNPEAFWESHPAYTQFILEGYALPDKLHEPTISIYPAKEFAQLNEAAARELDDLQKTLTSQQIMPDQKLPLLPLFNAAQVFHSQEKFVSFRNGTGIRYITQYDQAYLPINNDGLFYTFQGLTTDGEYYVSVILPINLPYLHADDTPFSQAPSDGVQFDWDHPENFPSYLEAIVERLDRADNIFTPSLDTLDLLIQSLQTFGQH